MHRLVKRTLMAVCIAAGVFALALSLGRIDRVEASPCTPSGTNWVSWNAYNPNTGEWPDVVRADASNNFTAGERFQWCYQNIPTNGAFDFEATSSNIDNPGYDPAYFFPSTEIGSVDVVWSGTLHTTNQNGTMDTTGWVTYLGSPIVYKELERSLTVKCHSTSSCP